MINVLYRDAITLLLLGFVCMVILMLPHLNPPAKSAEEDPPGDLNVYMTWDATSLDDVDLWVYVPGEILPVGYSNKSGIIINYLRDDRGDTELTKANFENTYSRGLPPGEYIINVHCFDCRKPPVKVQVEVSIKRAPGETPIRVMVTEVELKKGQELTAVRFKVDEKMTVVPDSINHLYKPLLIHKDGPPGGGRE